MDISKDKMLLGLGIVNLLGSGYFMYKMLTRYRTRKQQKNISPVKPERKSSSKKNNNNNRKEIQKIFRICLTGDHQSTITETVEQLKLKLQEKGYKVFVIPNLNLLTNESGVINDPNLLADHQKIKFIIEKVKYQISFEDYFTDLAVLASKPSVILCNGGVMDTAALVDEHIWQLVNDQTGWNNVHLRDGRYDQVLLISEDLSSQFRLQDAWTGHPQYSVINCNENREKSIDHSINLILKTIGMPVSTNIFKKYLIESFDIPKSVNTQTFQVEEVFLRSKENQELKVRKRGINGTYNYVISRRMVEQDQRNEIKRQISAQEYLNLIEQKSDETRIPVKKERIQFVYDSVTFNIDTVQNQQEKEKKNIQLLRYQNEKSVELPFIKLGREVTRNYILLTIIYLSIIIDDPNYNTYNLAKKNKEEK